MERIAKVELMTKVNDNTKKNLENEISGFIAQARQQREIIDRLQEDVLKYTKEGKTANAAYYAALEEVKYNEVKISELQRKTVESEAKLKQLQMHPICLCFVPYFHLFFDLLHLYLSVQGNLTHCNTYLKSF